MKQNPLSADLHHILDHTRDLWEDLRGARLFITGGTGFFGSWLVESFLFANQQLDLKASVSVLTRSAISARRTLPHLFLDSSITLLEGDVKNFVFPAGEFTHLIHAATENAPQYAQLPSWELFISNIDGTRRVLDFAATHGVRNFLFTSSGAVYGKQPLDISHIHEEHLFAADTTDWHTSYGQSKRASEFLCTCYSQSPELKVKIARCFAFVGPRLPLYSNYAIGNFIGDVLEQRSIKIAGDGTPRRSYLYSADLAIWLWTILLKGQALVYNVGSDEDLSILELAHEVVRITGSKQPVDVAMQPVSGQLAQRYVPSVNRARLEMGLRPWTSLTEAIRRTFNYHKNGSV